MAGLSRCAAVDEERPVVPMVPTPPNAVYAAPEVLRTQTASRKSDTWSFGVVLWELWAGTPPWSGLELEELLEKLLVASF